MDLFERHIHYFETEDEYEDARQNEYEEPWASFIDETDTVNYNKSGDELLEEMPLTFEILSDGVIVWKASTSATELTSIAYSINNSDTWETITSQSGDGVSISVSSGDIVQFKAPEGVSRLAMSKNRDNTNTFSGTSCDFNVKGNIMSLLNANDFKTLNSIGIICDLFANCTGLTNANKLLLPATALGDDCYRYLFSGCAKLKTAPELPATILRYRCYWGMFQDCTSLTTAPELFATRIPDNSYGCMFKGCISLKNAPKLSANVLGGSCYGSMFEGCTSLTTVPELPATTLAWGCYDKMFAGCTKITKAPELPATTIASYCYRYMFQGCTSLTQVPSILPASGLGEMCYYAMFSGCTSLTTAPQLPATTLGNNCYGAMFQGCTSLITAPSILPATTLSNGCYGSMFYGCTSLTTAPELPAATLVSYSYNNMFQGCSNLNYIKCLATDVSASQSSIRWVQGVALSGTFVKAASMTGWSTGIHGIPNNWTVQNAT